MVCAVRKIVIWELKLFLQGSFYSNILIDGRTNLSQIAIYVTNLNYAIDRKITNTDFFKEDKHEYLIPLLYLELQQCFA